MITQKQIDIVKQQTASQKLSALNNINNIAPPPIQIPLIQRIIQEPATSQKCDIETPLSSIIKEITENHFNIKPSMDLPANEGSEESFELAIMMQIRRRKMKKHKLKKLRKRMKFEWAKRNQRRELRKEKAFQANLLSQIRDAERFSAEEYVTMKLQRSKHVDRPLE